MLYFCHHDALYVLLSALSFKYDDGYLLETQYGYIQDTVYQGMDNDNGINICIEQF